MVNAQVVSAIDDAERESIVQIIRNEFGIHADSALAIAQCESGLNKTSVNWGDAKITGNPSWGIWQLNRPQFGGWDNPELNTQLAKEMFDRRGWQPWSCARRLNII